MVRLVFRPYTHVWRSICTSESLRASTRVSSGFTLHKRSSPSFGSYQIYSYSSLKPEERGRLMLNRSWHLILTFVVHTGFYTLMLAYWVDSFVRVSRRVSRSHFGKISRWILRLRYSLRREMLSPRFSYIRNLILPFALRHMEAPRFASLLKC